MPNQGEVALNNLPPGETRLWRPKRVPNGEHGTFLCDHRTFENRVGADYVVGFRSRSRDADPGEPGRSGLLALESTVVWSAQRRPQAIRTATTGNCRFSTRSFVVPNRARS